MMQSQSKPKAIAMCGVVRSSGLIIGKLAFEQGMITPEQLGRFAHMGIVRAMDKSANLYTNCHDWELIARRQGYPLRDRISFHFDFEEYKTAKNIPDDGIAEEQYRKDLSEMWFLISEIEHALGVEAWDKEQEAAKSQNNQEPVQDLIAEVEIPKRGPGRPRKEDR